MPKRHKLLAADDQLQPIQAASTTLIALESLSPAQRVQVLEGAIAFYDLKLADGRLRA